MAQQTAVEWLIAQVNSEQYQIAFGQTYISIDLIEQAKQMEKEQIIDCLRYAIQQEYYNHTWANCQSTSIAAEMYYNNIFK